MSGKLDASAAEALKRIKSRLEENFPSYRFAVFLDIGLPAEWRRQAQLAAGGLPPEVDVGRKNESKTDN